MSQAASGTVELPQIIAPNLADEITLFVKFFRQALGQVDNVYYGGNLMVESRLNVYGPLTEKARRSLLDYFTRYHERVFCYELYHRVRTLMDSHPVQFTDVVLQGELTKAEIGRAVQEYLRIKALDKEFMPDFLLHSPGNIEHQDVVIEVKCNPDLVFSDVKDDLEKINQFIDRYKYQLGVFLTVNTGPDSAVRMLGDKRHREWIRHHLPHNNRIIFMCHENRNGGHFEIRLDTS